MSAGATGHEELSSRVEALRARFALDLDPTTILTQLGESSRDQRYRMVLLEQLQRKAPERVADGCDAVLSDETAAIADLRMRAREILIGADRDRGLAQLVAAIDRTTLPVNERQHAVKSLRIVGGYAVDAVKALADQLTNGTVDSSIALEVLDLSTALQATGGTGQVAFMLQKQR